MAGAEFDPLDLGNYSSDEEATFLLKDETVLPFSCHPNRYKARPNHARVSQLEEILKERCNLLTSIYLDKDGLLDSYCYYLDNDPVPSPGEHHPVIRIQTQEKLVRSRVKSWWGGLCDREKDKLYMILVEGIAISEHITFNHNTQQWIPRTSPPGEDASYTSLAVYGDPSLVLSHGCSDVLSALARGRNEDQIKARIEVLEGESLGEESIAHAWEEALMSGMDSGSGRLAVFKLLDAIIGLRRGYRNKLPNIKILNMSTSANDASSTTTSYLSEQKSLSSCTPPPAKCPKREPCESPLEPGWTDHEKTKDRVTWPKHGHQFVDLKVASLDDTTGLAKYLILVAIHSGGKTLEEAKKELMKELIHVLQIQNEVFGLLFSKTSVFLYKATQNTQNGSITISYKEYNLIDPRVRDEYPFSVVKFQKLAMDIFSCILHGIKYIDT